MSYHSGRILTPGASRKRKEREVLYSATSPKPVSPQTAVRRAVSVTSAGTTSSKGSKQPQPQPPPPPLSSNRLLAGYMAYEFLSEGTLFGQKFDPARAEALPVNSAESKRSRQSQIQGTSEAEPSGKSTPHGYAEVAHILQSEGAHIVGVVNPTQLAKWIQM